MVIMETHRVKKRSLQQQHSAGERVVANMDEGKEQAEDRVTRDFELVIGQRNRDLSV
jgi:hypothetical protein